MLLDPAHETEPPPRENKDRFETLLTSMSVTVFFWFISLLSAGWLIRFTLTGVLIGEDFL